MLQYDRLDTVSVDSQIVAFIHWEKSTPEVTVYLVNTLESYMLFTANSLQQAFALVEKNKSSEFSCLKKDLNFLALD